MQKIDTRKIFFFRATPFYKKVDNAIEKKPAEITIPAGHQQKIDFG